MKRFFLAVALCVSLLGTLSIFLFPVTRAAENPLLTLLNLPAPPPPNPYISLKPEGRPANFFAKSNPPSDDDSIEALMDYWRFQSQNASELQYTPRPSEKVVDRLVREIEKGAAKLGDFINILPRDKRISGLAKEIYERGANGNEEEREQRGRLKRWLKYNTPLYSSELAREAAGVRDDDDYVTNHHELVALARVDWDRAAPIVNRLYNDHAQKASRSAAIWALYVHAMEDGSPSDVDRYRDELKEIVSDKSLGAGVRDLALDALSLEKEWPGRDEWYLTLLEDETLTDLGRFTGLTTLIATSPEGKYIDRMIALLDSDNIAVRSAAAQNLLDRIEVDRERIVRALLPWLSDPRWIRQTGRSGHQTIVHALTQVKIPESVPGLIAALDATERIVPPTISFGGLSNANSNANYERPEYNAAANAAASAANAAAAAANAAASSTYHYLRYNAVAALAFQKDPRAVPALRRILNERSADESYADNQLVTAIYECGGFSLIEQSAAVEEIAKLAGSESAEEVALKGAAGWLNSNMVASNAYLVEAAPVYAGPIPTSLNAAATPHIPLMLGTVLVTRTDVGDELPRAIIDRIAAVERTDTTLATALRRIVTRWEGPAVNIMLLRDLKNGKIDPDAVVKLLSIRKELREKQMSDLFDLKTGHPIAIGISSCLLEDTNDQDATLDSESAETKTALLACARLIRAPLRIEKVALNLSSKDTLLALAAERYLETEDSPEARRLVLSLHPGEAKILGATTAFYLKATETTPQSELLGSLFASVSPYYASAGVYWGEYDESNIGEIESSLQEEVKKDASLVGVYRWEENSIRIYRDKAVLSWQNDPARYRERVLESSEFDAFKGLLSHYKADELPPFLECTGGEECRTAELIMIGRNGGRRVFVKAPTFPPFFAEMDRMFDQMRQPPSTIKYWAAKDVPGLEVLFADDRLEAKAVWKNGLDFRLLTADKVRRAAIDAEIDEAGEDETADVPELDLGDYVGVSKERTKRQYENFAWNNFADGLIGPIAAQPEQIEYIPPRDTLAVPASSARWKARAGAIEIRADAKGLYKVVAGKLTKIRTGYFDGPVITPNGRWVIATRYDEERGGQLVRLNLLTNRMYVVESNERLVSRAVVYVPSLGRVLVAPFNEEYDDVDEVGGEPADDGGSYSLLDPETGVLIAARGEVRPLAQQTFRALQPTRNQFEYWAAIPGEKETVFGLYNIRNFNLKPILRLPKIAFDSMDTWVDEAGGKLYFVYEGHLLGAPIPK